MRLPGQAILCEEGHHLPAGSNRLPIVTHVEVGAAQGVMRRTLETPITQRCGESQGSLTVRNGLLCIARQPTMVDHGYGDERQPPRIVKGRGERFGLTQGGKASL